MQNIIQLDQNERNLRDFDAAFYSRLHGETPLLAFAIANIVPIHLEFRHTVSDFEDAWEKLKALPTRKVCRKLGIPLRVIRKVDTRDLFSPSLTEDLSMLRAVLRDKPRCARWLLHAKTFNLLTSRAMYMIDCDDAQMWSWYNALPSSTACHVVDILAHIHHVLGFGGRRWQHGMVRDEVSLAKTYSRVLHMSHFPEPQFSDSPRTIEAIRTGEELVSWGLKQRNCISQYHLRCLSGSVSVYRMKWPAEASILISHHGEEKPWLLEAQSRENGELDRHQIAVLLEWCSQQGIDTRTWLERGAL